MKRFAKPGVSRLGLKLFATILAVNVAICALIFLFVSRSLDQGFIDYLERVQAQRAETLATALGEEWAARGSWQWLQDNERAWFRLVHRQLWPDRERPPPGLQGRLSDPRDFLVRDIQGNIVIGPPPRNDADRRERGHDDSRHVLSIVSQGQQVGELVYRPPRELMARMDHIFIDRQQRNLSIIVGSLALASLLLAGVLSWWLGRRTRGMALATRRLTEGDYSVRLAERGHDELSRLARDFNVLAETLEANRQARQRWVADIAHELRTPLAVLHGEIEAMQDGIRPLNADSLGSLSQEVDQLERLVQDLRLLAQSDAGALDARLETLDLAKALRERLEDARGWLEGGGISLDLDIRGPAPVRGDLQRLHQLWNNLLSNTRAYTDAPGRLKIKLEVTGGQVRIRWEDSAPGVEDEELPRLTERLYRVEASRNRRLGGSGLGLSIARALVQAHGGDMQVSHSTLGGLCWTLRFPLAGE
ncbi:ATP-binding protein [Halomonas sp. McH1-25]|uniref:ATP-binding protein n=1 Tax=unclassified Halomonas TaxID=2609666 RepID=UPI001EF70E03|nr:MULTISPECIES: ATP-binding protein [unclassified Halomonas]MCG7600220.1 ATP-binding protein [Halomonas sp. McH1-25]MCP1343093.1 ATP-binding protein [Halomonas sp. FL8]MCP1360498.1 ATP-binding protein [Halomonas sp. BBD45]MCP1364400.1 ATP-binding protein [Halomonas sp. BBD48]